MFAYHKALASVYQDRPEGIIVVFSGGNYDLLSSRSQKCLPSDIPVDQRYCTMVGVPSPRSRGANGEEPDDLVRVCASYWVSNIGS